MDKEPQTVQELEDRIIKRVADALRSKAVEPATYCPAAIAAADLLDSQSRSDSHIPTEADWIDQRDYGWRPQDNPRLRNLAAMILDGRARIVLTEMKGCG